MSRTQRTKRNIIWGGIHRIEAILMPFLCRTVMIYTLGMQYVGLGSLFTSLLSILSFTELGIGIALVFSMYEPVAKGDDDKICALLYFYKKCYRVIGTIICVVGLAIMPFLDKFIAGDIPEGINIYILFAIRLLNTVIGYFFAAYRTSLLIATQRVDISSVVTMILDFITNALQIIVLLTIRNYYVYTFLLPLSTFANNLCIALITRKLYPQYTCRGNLAKGELHSIKEKVGGLVFQKIGGIILQYADTIVISAFLGLTTLGVYNSYYYVIQALTGFISVIQSALIPSMGNSIVTENIEKNHTDLKKFQFLYVWLLGWWSSCMLCLYQPFIYIWQGKNNMLSIVIVVLLSLYFYIHHMGDIIGLYKDAIGLWWQGKFVPLVSSIVNLGLNIVLVQIIGLSGVLLSTIISILFINWPLDSWVLFKYYFHSLTLWRTYLGITIKYFVQALFTAAFTYFICSKLPDMGIDIFLIKICICIVVPNVVLLLMNFKSELFITSASFVYRLIPTKLLPHFVKKYLNNLFENK